MFIAVAVGMKQELDRAYTEGRISVIALNNAWRSLQPYIQTFDVTPEELADVYNQLVDHDLDITLGDCSLRELRRIES
jgi:hypothetical protein